jgi:hypothetical protein
LAHKSKKFKRTYFNPGGFMANDLDRFLPPKHVSNFGGGAFHLSPRDIEMLDYIWKWKIPSSASIHEAVGRPNTPYSTFKALERLVAFKYIECVPNDRYQFKSWVLTETGFEAIRESLGGIKEDGYLSEYPWHDRNVLAFHMGEWSTYRFPVVKHFSEQELRRYPDAVYPEWVPRIPEHRSDGYSQIQGEKRSWLVAYEVELSAKAVHIYNSIIQQYRRNRDIDRVYWLVGDPYVKDRIIQAKTNVKDEQDNYHVFVDRALYQAKGWDAVMTNCKSETLTSLRENYRGMLGNPYGEYLANSWGSSKVSVHYDPRKVIGKSRG